MEKRKQLLSLRAARKDGDELNELDHLLIKEFLEDALMNVVIDPVTLAITGLDHEDYVFSLQPYRPALRATK